MNHKEKIEILPGYHYPEEIRTLFCEYTNTLVVGDARFAGYLEKQNFDAELLHLEEKYGTPYGRLYVALWEGKPAGCIGLRKIDEKNCEMKRLYVRPQFRGKGIGRILAQRIVEEAGQIGYRHMYLDTLPFLQTAITMYRNMGFYEVASYNNSPMENLVYLRLDL